MQRLGMVGATLDLALFAEFAKTFSTLDFDLYGATLEALGRHDARDVLPTVDVPMHDRHRRSRHADAARDRARASSARCRRRGCACWPAARTTRRSSFPSEVCEELERLFVEADSAREAVARASDALRGDGVVERLAAQVALDQLAILVGHAREADAVRARPADARRA